MQTACAVSPSVVCMALYIFPHYPINGTIFEKKKLLNMNSVFLFSLQHLYETFLVLRRIKRDIIVNVQYIGLLVKCPLFWSDFN
jgi:hypothetical protein